jgi:tetratricopeptide (TPR) repeat protein
MEQQSDKRARSVDDTEDTLAGDGTVVQSDRPLARGDVVGRYVILDRLGAGGMGVVHGAYDPDLDRKLALKLLHAHDNGSEPIEAQRRLLREAQAMAKLNHPNVVAIHDVGEHRGRVFLAMEFVAGQTLRTWSKGKSWREIVSVYLAAARGLAAAHAHELVHRDFKPDNVLVGDDGRVCVADFGLARSSGVEQLQAAMPEAAHVETTSRLETTLASRASGASGASGDSVTQQGALVGTPAYMAPEQFLGRPTTAAADQFSFCVSLYESLYGTRPFAAGNNAALALEVIEGRVRPPPSGTVPKWVRKIVMRGLAVDPEQRFASMDALAVALASDPVVRRRRAVGGLVIACLAAGAWFAVREQPSSAAAPCQDMRRHLEGAWDLSTRTELERALLETDAPLAAETWPRVARNLDDYAQAWVAGRIDACEATRVRGEQSEALMDQRMACLDARLEELAALVEVLRHADARIVDRAVVASASLSGLDRCADVEALLAEVPAPEDPVIAGRAIELRGDLAEIKALRFAGQIDEALVRAEQAVAIASELGHPATLARALLQRGDVQLYGDKPAEAEVSLIDAFRIAIEQGDAEVAATSSALLVRLLGQQLARFDEARVWGIEALALAQRQGDLDARTLALTAVGLSEDAAGDHEQARARFEAALELHQSREPPSEVGLGVAHNNLGNVAQAQTDFARARRDHERALELWRSALGPHHPYVADALNNLGVDARGAGQLDDARAFYEQALEIRRIASGPQHPSLAPILNNLGSVANSERDFAMARDYFERALAIVEKVQGATHPNVGRILGNLAAVALAQGEIEAALEYVDRSLTILDASLGPENPSQAFGLTSKGHALILLGRPAQAIAALERALELRTKNPTVAIDLAESRSLLGRALWLAPRGQGRDRERARELATQARAAYLEADDHDGVAAVDAWLGE